MALQVRNATAFSCQSMALMAKNGATVLRIVVKGSFDILADGSTTVSARQRSVIMEDEYWGEPGTSSIRYESDIILGKPGADLVVNGQAYAPDGVPATQMQVTLAYEGHLTKHLSVCGDRFWHRGFAGWGLSSPKPFRCMPVVYDRAFGGCDDKACEPRNRSGIGLATRQAMSMGDFPAPNIELQDQRVSSLSDRPQPAGLGVVARHWEPRSRYAGTYDEQWLCNQYPLLPDDFNDCFFHSVAPDQWIKPPQGGETITVHGMTPDGLLRFSLPPCRLPITLRYRDGPQHSMMQVETVLVEPDERQVVITWGATADIHADPFRLAEIAIGRATAGMPDLGGCGC